MTELITAFGLMLVIEGCLYALFPNHLKQMIAQVLAQKSDKIRIFGIALVLIGFFIIWLVRGH